MDFVNTFVTWESFFASLGLMVLFGIISIVTAIIETLDLQSGIRGMILPIILNVLSATFGLLSLLLFIANIVIMVMGG